ncbi:MAG: hydantoinase/oxoprolinase family protein [Sterolibacterium sp.]
MEAKNYLVACDAGGTMTDLFVMDTNGRFVVGKAATTPHDQSLGFMESLGDAMSYWGIDFEKKSKEVVPKFLNAVYTGTSMLNCMITRSGQKVGLIVTKGFEYMLEQGRGKESVAGYPEAQLFHSVFRKHKEPFVPLRRIAGITERIDIKGNVAIPLYEHEIAPAVEMLLDEGIESLGICFLCSFANPLHEQMAGRIAKEAMIKAGREVPIYLSHEVAPIIRETSRLNSLVIQAYASEASRKQLFHIENALKKEGLKQSLQVVLSYGTVADIRYPRIHEATVSGPIGGITGGAYLGKIIGQENIVCTDMGGTTFEVGVITKGKSRMVREPEFCRMYLSVPMLDCESIGAGTGTYIRIDPYTNRILLGPDSAAGFPGPVCYDMGNETPTVGDCDLLLNRINPDYYLGGKMKLNREHAYKNFKEQIADKLGLDVYEAAEGIIRMVDLNMGDHLRSSLIGYDPKDYVVMGYGGASGLHLVGFAGESPWKGVCTMPWAAGFSAFGCAAMDYAHRYSKTAQMVLPHGASEAQKIEIAEALDNICKGFAAAAVKDFAAEGIAAKELSYEYFVYMQYLGQLDEVEVPFPVFPVKSAADIDKLVAAFEQIYGEQFPLVAKSVEAGYRVIEVGVVAKAPTVKPVVPKLELAGKVPPEKAYKTTKSVFFDGKWTDTKVYELDEIQPGNEVDGALILEGPAYTLLVPPGRKIRVDEHRVIWVDRI